MKNSNTKMNKKTYQHGAPYNSDSEASGIEMPVPFYKRELKKRCLLFSSESEDDSIKVAPKRTKRKTKFSWTRRHFEPTIYEFDNQNSGIKTNIARKSPILEMFQTFFFGRVNRIHCKATNLSKIIQEATYTVLRQLLYQKCIIF